MARAQLSAEVGGLDLRTPLIAASGTVGSVHEWVEVARVSAYGAAVAKSVAPVPWDGRKPPRVAPLPVGMLNGIGIQNPGIEHWVDEMSGIIPALDVPVWGSAVAEDVDGFGHVAKGLEAAGVAAIEVNLSCPNLDDGEMFSFDAARSRDVVDAVVSSVTVPVGAKLSPNTPDVVGVAMAVRQGGAAFVVLTNTALGFGVSLAESRPVLSGGVGGYSGPGLKPISMRCVYEVTREMPDFHVIGCGGVMTGRDVLEYLAIGARAVEAGTIHFAEPNAGERIIGEMEREMGTLGVSHLDELIGTVGEW